MLTMNQREKVNKYKFISFISLTGKVTKILFHSIHSFSVLRFSQTYQISSIAVSLCVCPFIYTLVDWGCHTLYHFCEPISEPIETTSGCGCPDEDQSLRRELINI